MKKALLSETVLQLIEEGESGKETLEHLTTAIIDSWGEMEEGAAGPITTSTVQDMVDVACFLRVIVGMEIPQKFDADVLVTSFLEARRGAKLVVKQALRYWETCLLTVGESCTKSAFGLSQSHP